MDIFDEEILKFCGGDEALIEYLTQLLSLIKGINL